MIFRIFVEKKKGFDVSAVKMKSEVENVLGIKCDTFREILRYDVEGIAKENLSLAVENVFSEPPCDTVHLEKINISEKWHTLAIEYLPGQYDQRADSAASCIQLLLGGEKPTVRCARIYVFNHQSEENLQKIKSFLINPVDSREASLSKPDSLAVATQSNIENVIISGFEKYSDEQIESYHAEHGFAMTVDDLKFVRDYFAKCERSPYETELKVIDTYWSDHCRHTTFLTELKNIEIESENIAIERAYEKYKALFADMYKDRSDKYPCLMDIATIGAKKLKAEGLLNNLDLSDEINACSIKQTISVDGKDEDYIVMFKNETHNHPTEIEPFGGAATCLGGAIRDPLSGRTFVYQSMRITGAADPTTPFSETLKGKLPQSVITKLAAKGFSSYGNQIGLATGQVVEVYHENFVAKRLETGFVVASGKAKNIVREKPTAGDVIILLGGETGRDGCGGATGSSKVHTLESVEKCGAEVQKGNPLTERKIQRLFRSSAAARLIKKCNDFGAGGVSVAIGELADGLEIDLDKITKKYEGLTGTELAISESQERMAVVVSSENADKFIALAREENLMATVVATVTEARRLKMFYGGECIVDLERDFLDTNGTKQNSNAKISDRVVDYVQKPFEKTREILECEGLESALLYEISRLNVCSQKGLVENFDSTIGAKTVLLPLGGKKQLTPSNVMAAKIDCDGETNSATVCAYGYNPYLMEQSCFVGASYSVVISLNKLIASGTEPGSVYFSFQEYFKKLHMDKEKWGLPLAALLGALDAQLGLKRAAIGGKDSMSGSFENIDVPNTLISFALGIANTQDIITNVLEPKHKKLYQFKLRRDKFSNIDYDYLTRLHSVIHKNIKSNNITFATIVDEGGSYASVVKSAISNQVGIEFIKKAEYLLTQSLGDFVLACEDIDAFEGFDFDLIARINTTDYITVEDVKISYDTLEKQFTSKLEKVFPTTAKADGNASFKPYTTRSGKASEIKYAKPRVIIPLFAGTNCEYDTQKAFERAGASVKTVIMNNLTSEEIMQSVKALADEIKNSQIVMFAGGFSGGDEPDGSGKFIATTFRNQLLKDEMHELLLRGGLTLGICNGFQALIKLGLVPNGKIEKLHPHSATLTYNNISRHISTISKIKVASVKSVWLKNVNIGEVYDVAISHGEGRFVFDNVKKLVSNGQVATQYCDNLGNITMKSPFNPNGSQNAVEGITSLDGRVFGKMGHSERIGKDLYKNYEGNFDMKIFESGVDYFK